MDGIDVSQWHEEHAKRIELHAARVAREQTAELVECIEHPEWGLMPISAARRRGGTTTEKIGRAVATGGTGGFLHWCRAGERDKFTAKHFDCRTCCQQIQCVETGVTYPSVRAACDAYGLRSRHSIVYAIRNHWTAGGVHWRRVGQRPAAVLKRMARRANAA